MFYLLPVFWCFNGAAVRYRGKEPFRVCVQQRTRCFNGAAVRYRGKVAEAKASNRERVASMGPR